MVRLAWAAIGLGSGVAPKAFGMRLAWAVAIGFGSGVASGAFGIGGALLSTPGIRWALGTPAIIAVGTTLPAIVPTAATGLWTYYRSGFVDLRTAAVAAAFGSGFAVLGAWTTDAVLGEALLVVTAALILVSALRMVSPKASLRPPPIAPTPPAVAAVGAVSGYVSGLLGVGGGIILVPAFTVLLGMPVKTALGTSLAVIAAQAIPGSVVHALLGHIDWTVAAALSVAVIPGARLGARVAVAARDASLRVAVGLGMAAIALAFGLDELRRLWG